MQNDSWVYQQVGDAVGNWPTILAQVVPNDASPTTYNVKDVSGAGANTETCRIYHLTAAATGAVAHCSHGGVLGGGQCPLNHPEIPACTLITKACPSAFADAAACQAAFLPYFADQTGAKMGDPRNMMANPPTTDTIACRLYHATMAVHAVAMNMTMSNANYTKDCDNAKIAGASACGMMMAPTSGVAPVAASAFLSVLMLLW
jgi:hypothetical protein